jgi:hypothetical protein
LADRTANGPGEARHRFVDHREGGTAWSRPDPSSSGGDGNP